MSQWGSEDQEIVITRADTETQHGQRCTESFFAVIGIMSERGTPVKSWDTSR